MPPTDDRSEKQSEKKKARGCLPLILAFLLLLALVIAAGGLFGVVTANALDTGDEFPVILFLSLCLFLFCVTATYLAILLHEAGHLLFGLLSGYRFRSFRIGRFLWVKEGAHIRLRRLYRVGRGSECLLAPPEEKNGRFPVLRHKLGGAFVSLLFGLLFLYLTARTYGTVFWPAVFCYAAMISLLIACVTGLPFRFGLMSNDGYQALMLKRNQKERLAYHALLYIHDAVAGGTRLRDLPEDRFSVTEDDAQQEPMQASLAVLRCNRLMDAARFDEAETAIRSLLNNTEAAISGVHRTLLLSDLLYLVLLNEETRYTESTLLSKEQEDFLKLMQDHPSVVRTGYTYLLLKKRDTEGALRLRRRFETVAANYPYPADLIGERSFLSLADKIYALENGEA